MTVYVYKEHCDENAYGAEIIEVFEDRQDALDRLKESVEKAYNCTFEKIADTFGADEDDTVEPDYVSINSGDGAVYYWVVEEKEIKGSKEEQEDPRTDFSDEMVVYDKYKTAILKIAQMADKYKPEDSERGKMCREIIRIIHDYIPVQWTLK